MKKSYIFLIAISLTICSLAQVPQKMSYQAVIRNANNTLVVSQKISMKVSILKESITGKAVYVEIHKAATNASGLLSLEIGSGDLIQGTFASINWAVGPYFIMTEVDPTGGTDYTITGINQLMSVPYALYSGNGMPAGNNPGDMCYWTGTSWTPVAGGEPGQVLTFSQLRLPVWAGNSYPTVTTKEATGVTSTSAVSGGNITSDGGAPISLRGICWNISELPTTTNSVFLNVAGTGEFTSPLTAGESRRALRPGTKYYVRAFGTNNIGTSYGNEINFKTLSLPILTTAEPNHIGSTTAFSGGNVLSDGGTMVIERGVCWSKNPNPSIINEHSSNGSGTGEFISPLIPAGFGEPLAPGTTYYVKAYATSAVGTSYGNEVSFMTLLFVTTAPASNITATSAICGGTVNADEDTKIIKRGVCWSTSPMPTLRNFATIDGSGTGLFTSLIPSGLNAALLPETVYYVRAYATSSAGIFYGEQIVFTTLRAVIPCKTLTVSTSEIAKITSHSAVSGGNVVCDGGAKVYARGICWSTDQNPTLPIVDGFENFTVDGTGAGEFSSIVGGASANLTAATLYYVRAYATNFTGTAYGTQMSFATLPAPPTIPTLAPTTAATAITATSAESGGDVISDGGAALKGRGLCWSTAVNPTSNDPHFSRGTKTGVFTSYVGGSLLPLMSGTCYYVRSYAANEIGTAYGAQISFNTLKGIPTLAATTPVTEITFTSAKSGGVVLCEGGERVTARGVCWSTTYSPTTLADQYAEAGTGKGEFVCSLVDLLPGTTYYARSYASNSIGTSYSNPPASFKTTSVVPILVTTLAPSGITTTSAVVGGDITRNGGEPILERGVYCTLVQEFDVETKPFIIAGTTAGSFSATITNLIPNSQYEVTAYARNSIGIGYAPTVKFATLALLPALPTVTTAAISMITSTGAVSGGNVTSDGSTKVSARGICWSTRVNPVTNNFQPAYGFTESGSGSGAFTCATLDEEASPLSPGTIYYVRAFARNTAGTVYGDQLSFKTLAVLPTLAATTPASSITAISAVSGGNITNDGGAPITGRGICWSSSPNPTISNISGGPDCYAGTGTGTFACTVGAEEPGWLQSASTYYVRAYATNSIGTVYATQISFKTLPAPPAIPMLAPTTAATAITATGAESGGNVISDGGAALKGRGLCWSTAVNPTSNDPHFSRGTKTGVFTSYVGGSLLPLMSGTCYYVRSYAANEIGTAYGAQISFNTLKGIPTLAATTPVTEITFTSAKSGGVVLCEGGERVTARGVCWSTTYSPTTLADQYAEAGTGKGEFVCSLVDLLPGTTYYARSYASNSIGTSYSNPSASFKTTSVVPILVTTLAPSGITTTSAFVGGDITRNGGEPILERGVYCTLVQEFDVETKPFIIAGTTAGSFSATITNLIPNSQYEVTAYARNSIGIGYAPTVKFATLALLPALPTVTTAAISMITSTGAVSGGNVTSDGSTKVSARGICWSTRVNPVTNNFDPAYGFTESGSGSGAFTCATLDEEASPLSPGTIYYVRAFARNTAGTVYGDQLSFKTLAVLPTLAATTPASSITAISAVSGGNITNDGGSPITGRGICWSTYPNPVLSNLMGGPEASAGKGAGIFTCTVGNEEPGWLQSASTYYVRAYATNSIGTVYATQISFKTLLAPPAIPMLAPTTAASAITATSAVSGGNVISNGGAVLTARGVCWSTTQNPTILSSQRENALPSSRIETGLFTSAIGSITPLIPATLYYVRSYAINKIGIAYGEQISFTTLKSVSGCKTLTILSLDISKITSNSAIGGGNITCDGSQQLRARGVCWSTNPTPTLRNDFTNDGTETGEFKTSIPSGLSTGLLPGTKYYVRAYVTGTESTAYGEEKTFTTLKE